jgi:hypothetical protein
MSDTGNHSTLTKVIAVAAIASLMFMGLSFVLAPNEAAQSKFTLTVHPLEPTTKFVSPVPGSSVDFDLQIDWNDPPHLGAHWLLLDIANASFTGPDADPLYWDFTFLGSELGVNGLYYIYETTPLPLTITLRVTYLSTTPGELVHFTIEGLESPAGSTPPYQIPGDTPYEENYTRLYCENETGIEYLNVFSEGPYVPLWEDILCYDEVNLSCSEYGIFDIVIYNHGSAPLDNIPIVDWEMWYDVNENGAIDPGDIQVDSFFDVFFEIPLGGPYTLGDDIWLGNGMSQPMTVKVLTLGTVDVGFYLLNITIESQNSGIRYSDVVTAFQPPLQVVLTNPVAGWYYRPGHIITMDFVELTGANVVEVHYYYDDGNGPVEIIDSDPDTPGVQWDTSEIPGPFCNEGWHNVTVWVEVYDDHCRYGASDPVVIYFCEEYNPDPCVLTIAIHEGWNLITIGVGLDELGANYTASQLAFAINEQAGEDIIKYVVMWEGSGQGAGKFTEYVVESDIGYDFPIEQGEGYYVYSLSPFVTEFTIVGDCPDCETFDLIECWNLVGYQSMTSVPVGEWAALIESFYDGQPFIQAIVKYDHFLGDYVAWYPGDPVDLFYVIPGEAYWIFSATDRFGAPFPE